MRKSRWFAPAFAGMLLGVALLGADPAPAEDIDATFQTLVDRHADTLVTVKYVLKISMAGFGEQESEQEIGGIMIDGSGLVLVSNTQLGGFTQLFKRFGGEMTALPTDLKVLVGEDTEGRDAELMARDTELDLAWVRIADPADEAFATLDLSKTTTPKRGQRLLAVARMGKYFDRVPVVYEARVGGLASKPRELIVPSTPASQLGMPVFTADGALVGITILQLPDDEGAGDPVSMMSQMTSPGGGMAGLILPAETVARATERAKATVEEAEE